MNEKKTYLFLFVLFLLLLNIFIIILKINPIDSTKNNLEFSNSFSQHLKQIVEYNIIYMHKDKTKDNNIRYYNDYPNNYVLFKNCELYFINNKTKI